MMRQDGWLLETSPFHEGEIAAQKRVGAAETMDQFGRKVVRPYLTEELRAFFTDLPLVYVGHVDEAGRPWASVLSGATGFIASPNSTTLAIDADPVAGDPLAAALAPGAAIGMVGVGVGNRRRNRVNGHVSAIEDGRVTVTVDQAFGNCPQYIRPRTHSDARPKRVGNAAPARLTTLDDAARTLIGRSESFYVASFSNSGDDAARTNGADVSHRGGKPGFVKIEGDTLTIPDFAGNSHFNTLGNFLLEPRAGLLFLDWETGAALMLTGSVEIQWDGPEVDAFRGAERLWRFKVEEGVWLDHAIASDWTSGEASPNSLITGDWDAAAATLAAEKKRNAWRPYRVAKIEDESSVIRSFYLEPADGDGLVRAKPGQHLTIRAPAGPEGENVVRSYTLSSAPSDSVYRLSIKREDASGDAPNGVMSTWLHANLSEGDQIEARAPAGSFYLDTTERRPAVLIPAGVGVTPMIAMAREAAYEGLRSRHLRPLTVIHAARSAGERAFAETFQSLGENSDGRIRYVSVLSDPQPGDAYDFEGRIDAGLIKSLLGLDDYDFFLCGPPAFMQALYTALRSLGVRDARIFAEAFGPAALDRTPDEGGAEPGPEPEAEEAVVAFTQTGVEQSWTKGGPTLLELAESEGLSPDYGCRSGTCGACAVPLKSGKAAYRTPPRTEVADGSVLICCATPAADSERVELDL